MTELHHDAYQKSVQDLVNLYEDGHLNLSPGFQRDSVWTERDRTKLMDSIIRNYPLPSIFLYRRVQDGETVYDVIDGKQRLESIFRFMGCIWGKKYWAKVQLPGETEKEWIDWKALCAQQKQHLITGYTLRVIEVDGDLSDIVDVFVRINSTGKALTPAEKRHALYYKSKFLKAASRLAARYEKYFRQSRILSAGQITRMKHVELICELMISMLSGDVINKKSALDRVMATDSFTPTQIQRAKDKTVAALNRVKRIFPRLKETRFCQVSDFYTLVVLIAKFQADKLILTDPRRNRLAWDLLRVFSNGVDEARELQKQAKGVPPQLESCREYLLTVQQATDRMDQRLLREGILRGLLQSLFEKQDSKRTFSQVQRRILWNAAVERCCTQCGKKLTWESFTIDHIAPYSKGGRTRLDNAALMCRGCNSKKGNRRGSRR